MKKKYNQVTKNVLSIISVILMRYKPRDLENYIISINGIDLSPDYSKFILYVSSIPNHDNLIQILMENKSMYRNKLARSIIMRRVPDILFKESHD